VKEGLVFLKAEKGRVKEGLVFLKAEKGRRRKGWFKKSFSEGKMKEGAGFEILRRKDERRPSQVFKIVHFHAKIGHFGGILAKIFMLRMFVGKNSL